MNQDLFQQLKEEGILDTAAAGEIEKAASAKHFSIHWQLTVLLYLGVSILSAGLGIFIYQNIDSIGHLTIVVLIGLISAVCFFYSFKNLRPFSREKVKSQGVWHDYILLLGCLTFLIFEGYLQWQFSIFGDSYGLATIIPAVALLFVAYRYDHLGVLTLGLTLFSSWLGISLAPHDFFNKNDVGGEEFIYSGLILGGLFALMVWLHKVQHFKQHYTFTYANFAAHLGCIAALGAIMTFEYGFLWTPLLIGGLVLLFRYAMAIQSFYLTLCGALYGYIGFSYLFISKVVMHINDELAIHLAFYFFIGSAIATYAFLKRLKRLFHDISQ